MSVLCANEIRKTVCYKEAMTVMGWATSPLPVIRKSFRQASTHLTTLIARLRRLPSRWDLWPFISAEEKKGRADSESVGKACGARLHRTAF